MKHSLMMNLALVVACAGIVVVQAGCPLAAQVAPVAVLTVVEAACVVEHYGEPVMQILSDCHIGADKQGAVQALAQSVAKKVGEEKAAASCH